MKWYFEVLKKYAVFKGRASRKEFWMFFLVHSLIQIALAILDAIVFGNLFIFVFYTLGTLLPYIAVFFRRLRDIGYKGWTLWILFLFSLAFMSSGVPLGLMLLKSEPIATCSG